MIAPLVRNPNFLLFWLAGFISLLGDHLLGIALPYYVYAQTGSALATGATVVANHLPPILLGSVAGVFADRWEKKARYDCCRPIALSHPAAHAVGVVLVDRIMGDLCNSLIAVNRCAVL